jgi:hypothetical protein
MTREKAEASVRAILADIDGHKWRDLFVPHGFAVGELAAEERDNPFAPGLLTRWEVTAQLDVPVIYSPDSSSGIVRAALPANRDNVEALREWIRACARGAPARRVRLRDWKVSPDDAPAPYLPDGTPNGPPPDWSITAVLEVA